MSAIYQKELKGYFKSLSGWLFLAALTFFGGLYFSLNNLIYGSPYLSETLATMLIVLLFLIPILTMRSFAEEKKFKTDQLLLTAPVRVSSIIFGKFFAMATIMAIATMIFSMGIILVAVYGSVPVAETVMALIAFFLYGCICIAIGMFLSSVTEHQFIAAILTYGFYIFMILVPSFCEVLLGADSWLVKALSILDVTTPFNMLFSGIIVPTDIVYIFSALFVLLFLTWFMVGKNSFQLTNNGKKNLFKTAIGTVVVIAIVIAFNIGVRQLPTEYAQIDMTQHHWYSITDETKAVLDTLDEEVTIYVIGSKETVDDGVRLYLDAYKKYSNKINVEYKPLDTYPTFAAEMTGSYMDESGMIVVKGDDYRTVSYGDCYVIEYGYDSYGMLMDYVSGIDIEGQLTAAIGSLISDEKYTVYFLEGHNEVPIYESLLSRFHKGGYATANLSLLKEKEVPADAVTLVINGPENDLSAAEVTAIKEYVNRGGNLIMMASLDIKDTPNYDALMESYGVNITEGSVLESDMYYVYNEVPFAILPDNEYHDITASVYNSKYTLMIQSRGFTVDETAEGMDVYPLFSSQDNSYAKVLTPEALVEFEEGNEVGPFMLGVCTEMYTDSGELATITMIGSPAFIYEDIDMIVANANTDVFFGAVNYGSDVEVVTTIPAKSIEPEYVMVSSGLILLYTSLIVLLLPISMVITGIVIVIVRRKK